MSKFKSLLEKVSQSMTYHLNIFSSRVFVNPEVRYFMKEKTYEIKNRVTKKVEEDVKEAIKLQQTYEYKVGEHLCKIEIENEDKTKRVLQCDFSFLDRPEEYKYGYNRNIFKRIFFKEYYSTPHKYQLNMKNWLFIICLSLFSLKVGYHLGFKDSILYDSVKYELNNIKNEDSLFNLVESENKPLLVLYYTPGSMSSHDMQFYMTEIYDKYMEHINIAKVNCKYNVELCMKKAQYLNFPQWEIMFPPVKEDGVKKFPVIPCVNERSKEGLEGFLMKENIIEDEYNPIQIIRKVFN